MEFNHVTQVEMENQILQICKQGDENKKNGLIRESRKNSMIPALVLNNLYELVDYDLNFLIEVLNYSSEREKTVILRNCRDEEGIGVLFSEYDHDTLKNMELEDIVQGKDMDIIWEVKRGHSEGDLSRAYLTRCLLTIAYHIGFSEEVKAFFESEKRKYLTLH